MFGKYSYIITPKGIVLCGEWGAMTAFESAQDVIDLKQLLDQLKESERKEK